MCIAKGAKACMGFGEDPFLSLFNHQTWKVHETIRTSSILAGGLILLHAVKEFWRQRFRTGVGFDGNIGVSALQSEKSRKYLLISKTEMCFVLQIFGMFNKGCPLAKGFLIDLHWSKPSQKSPLSCINECNPPSANCHWIRGQPLYTKECTQC